jgi:hypothetical protein
VLVAVKLAFVSPMWCTSLSSSSAKYADRKGRGDMPKQGTVTVVSVRPFCDFGCTSEAKIDGRTQMGSWANMCLNHWLMYGCGKLGVGHGQKLALAPKNEGGE